jgi:uncharacterized protein YjiS (DUF1127 family)
MFLSLLIEKVNAYIAQREAIETLSQLEDHELKDIGIQRDTIEQAVRGEKLAA